MLIAAAGRPVSVDALLLATYGEDASPGGKATLHTYVSNLRRVLGDVIVRQGDAYFLDCAEATIDAAVFEEACRARCRDRGSGAGVRGASRGVVAVAWPRLRRHRGQRTSRR